MRIASAVGMFVVVLLAAAAAACTTAELELGLENKVANAVEVPSDAPQFASPEGAALAAAAAVWQGGGQRVAEVVFRFPAPDDYDVRVRVSDDSGLCRVFGASQVDLDGSARAGWVSAGPGNSYC